MKEKIITFELLLHRLETIHSPNLINNFEIKPAENKWSKKEIIGHLIDSAINNIRRFTEILYFEKPYKITAYNQDELVRANHYQNKDIYQMYMLWLKLNDHIIHLVKNQTEDSLSLPLILPTGEEADLRFLIEDYFEHFYHHLKQINAEWI